MAETSVTAGDMQVETSISFETSKNGVPNSVTPTSQGLNGTASADSGISPNSSSSAGFITPKPPTKTATTRPPRHPTGGARNRRSTADDSKPNRTGSDPYKIPSEPKAAIPGTATADHLYSDVHELEEPTEENEEGLPAEVLGALMSPKLEDDTPAAAALRANASIRVSRVNKFARRIKAQNIRRLVKTAALKGKSGVVRGKPPRVPPSWSAPSGEKTGTMSMPNVYDSFLAEEMGDGDLMDSSIDSDIIEEEDEEEEIKVSDAIATAYTTSQSKLANSRSASMPAILSPPQSLSDTISHSNVNDPLVVVKDRDETKSPHSRFADDGIPIEVHTIPNADGKKAHKDHKKIIFRRKKPKAKTDRSTYVKGKVIDGQHELYTLSIAMMLGLRTSIGRTNVEMNKPEERQRWLESDDFMHAEKYIFKPKGGPKTPPHELSHTFKFKDYSPKAFAYLRRMFGINEFDFLVSVCGNANFIEFVSNAKSGQFFFYSNDGKYMIKTMTNAESKFLRRILPHYFRHCAQNPNTLITRFLGMYRVKLYHLRRNVKFIIMNSVFDTDKSINAFYDLKGSTIGREAKPHQDVKKDNDFRRLKPDSVMQMYPKTRERVREQLVADCEFFKKMEIMDYSMLVGIHPVPLHSERNRNSATGHPGMYGSAGLHRRPSAANVPQSESTEKGIHRGKAGATPPRRSVPTAPPLRSHASPGGVASSAASYSSDAVVVGTDSVASLPTVDYIFEDDDENSYLEGSYRYTASATATVSASRHNFPEETDMNNYHVAKEPHGVARISETIREATDRMTGGHHIGHFLPHINPEEGSLSSKLDDVEMKKSLTAKQMFWPFHRFYDINGRRRMVPARCPQCEQIACTCDGNGGALQRWRVPPFVPPLSDRKDGGFMMDTTGFQRPLKMLGSNGPVIKCESKIFYMGVIDILQQYSIRKRLEARIRRFQGAGWKDASCVHPNLYGDRFIEFFDEYTRLEEENTIAPIDEDPKVTQSAKEEDVPEEEKTEEKETSQTEEQKEIENEENETSEAAEKKQ